MKELIYYCPVSHGGIADYGHAQAKSLAMLGVTVRMLCPRDFPHEAENYIQVRSLESSKSESKSRIQSRIRTASQILGSINRLVSYIKTSEIDYVLFATYSEYLAPLWAFRMRQLKKKLSIRFAAVVHDPIRTYQVGPKWWHVLSISQGYSFLDLAFVHEEVQLQGADGIRKMTIPHGPYPYPQSVESSEGLRAKYNLPMEATVILSFGHIRDNKNLDLIIQSVAGIENVYLIIAGSEAPLGQRMSNSYKLLAEELGVEMRTRWFVDYIEEQQVAELFGVSDIVALTYSKEFRSASGVLNIAANYGNYVLASAGESSLLSSVAKYDLGEVVSADSLESMIEGIRALMAGKSRPQWEEYREANSWAMNANLVIDAFRDLK